MSFEVLLLFIPASFVLNLSPGPNNLLAMSNGVRYGFFPAILGGFGRLAAFITMIALTSVGLGAVLSTSETVFYIIKWFGTAYLMYLGIKIWFRPLNSEVKKSTTINSKESVIELARQEFLIAIGNPKAILIFTAFFPQFMNSTSPVLPQFLVIGTSFLILEYFAICVYSFVGTQFGFVKNSTRGQKVINRFSGGVLIGSGALLALVDRNK